MQGRKRGTSRLAADLDIEEDRVGHFGVGLHGRDGNESHEGSSEDERAGQHFFESHQALQGLW